MRLRFTAYAAGLCVALAATMAQAQGPQLRLIEQGAAQAWKHERTGVVFPTGLIGLKRSVVQDTTNNEYDVAAIYGDGYVTGLVTIYVYRPAVTSVPLWFDRAQTSIVAFRGIGSPKAATIFAPPGSKTASAMRVSYPMPGEATATALAMVPVGDWLLKIRITAPGTPEAVESRIDEILAALALPDQPDAPVAAEVQPCAEPLKYGKAKALKPDGAHVMLVAITNLRDQVEEVAEAWCREKALNVVWGHYRKTEVPDGYVLALGDSGRALQVKAVPALDEGKKPDYSLAFIDAGVTIQFPLLSALPVPEKAIEFTKKLKPVARIPRDSKEINLMLDNVQFD